MTDTTLLNHSIGTVTDTCIGIKTGVTTDTDTGIGTNIGISTDTDTGICTNTGNSTDIDIDTGIWTNTGIGIGASLTESLYKETVWLGPIPSIRLGGKEFCKFDHKKTPTTKV